MTYASVIDIGSVLNRFDDTIDEHDNAVKEYGIRFITSDGRLRTMRARKNIKAPKQELSQAPQERGKFKYNLKRNGVMLLHDLDLDEPRTVKVATMFAFRNFNEKVWHRIYH